MEQAYLKRDLGAFVRLAQQSKANDTINNEMTDPKAQIFKKGTMLTTLAALAAFDPNTMPYVQALLEAGADPNYKNKTLNGMTVLENLVANAEPNFDLEDTNLVQQNLYDLIELLISYGVDTSKYEGNRDTIGKIIDKVLLNYASDIDTTPDPMLLYNKLCQELSKENNIRQLQMLAQGLGIEVHGKKADICSTISQYLITQK